MSVSSLKTLFHHNSSTPAHLIHDTDESTTHHSLSHILDFVDNILGFLDLFQQYTDICAGIDLLLEKKVEKYFSFIRVSKQVQQNWSAQLQKLSRVLKS